MLCRVQRMKSAWHLCFAFRVSGLISFGENQITLYCKYFWKENLAWSWLQHNVHLHIDWPQLFRKFCSTWSTCSGWYSTLRGISLIIWLLISVKFKKILANFFQGVSICDQCCVTLATEKHCLRHARSISFHLKYTCFVSPTEVWWVHHWPGHDKFGSPQHV